MKAEIGEEYGNITIKRVLPCDPSLKGDELFDRQRYICKCSCGRSCVRTLMQLRGLNYGWKGKMCKRCAKKFNFRNEKIIREVTFAWVNLRD